MSYLFDNIALDADRAMIFSLLISARGRSHPSVRLYLMCRRAGSGSLSVTSYDVDSEDNPE